MMRTEGRGVRDDGHDRPSADREMLVRSAIGSWRDSLIKATEASQLLDLGPGGTPMVRVVRPSAGDDLAATLRTLMRRSDQEYLDRGLWVLYLAFGALTWTGKDSARYTSPVLLVPVRLVATGPRQLPALEPAEDDPVVNPVLIRKLAQHGITLPPMDEVEEVTLGGCLKPAGEGVPGREAGR